MICILLRQEAIGNVAWSNVEDRVYLKQNMEDNDGGQESTARKVAKKIAKDRLQKRRDSTEQ